MATAAPAVGTAVDSYDIWIFMGLAGYAENDAAQRVLGSNEALGRQEGAVAEVTMKIILRDFETAGLATKAEMLRAAAREIEAAVPGCKIDIQINKQYRNMGDGLAKEPRAVANAQEAYRRLNRPCQLTIIRGGTDGSQLTERGLPTPNLSTGEHNPHSPLEWTCLEEMTAAVEMLVELVQLWGAERA